MAKALKYIEGRFEPLITLEMPRHPEENDRWRSDANQAFIFNLNDLVNLVIDFVQFVCFNYNLTIISWELEIWCCNFCFAVVT